MVLNCLRFASRLKFLLKKEIVVKEKTEQAHVLFLSKSGNAFIQAPIQKHIESLLLVFGSNFDYFVSSNKT